MHQRPTGCRCRCSQDHRQRQPSARPSRPRCCSRRRTDTGGLSVRRAPRSVMWSLLLLRSFVVLLTSSLSLAGLKNSYLPSVGTTVVVAWGTDADSRAVSADGNIAAAVVVDRIPLDVAANLDPGRAAPVIDSRGARVATASIGTA